MPGGARLNHRQEAAVAALLAQPTVEAAAAACGVSTRTLANWLRRPAFLAAYRDARRQVVEEAVAAVQRLGVEAAAAMHRALCCGRPAVELAAAFGVHDRAVKGVEVLDLVSRVEALEAAVAARQAGEPSRNGAPA